MVTHPPPQVSDCLQHFSGSNKMAFKPTFASGNLSGHASATSPNKLGAGHQARLGTRLAARPAARPAAKAAKAASDACLSCQFDSACIGVATFAANLEQTPITGHWQLLRPTPAKSCSTSGRLPQTAELLHHPTLSWPLEEEGTQEQGLQLMQAL